MSGRYSKEDILSFLKLRFVMEIATANDNKPSASVVMYDVDEELSFYFATHGDSFKARNLKANPQISLTVWEHDKMLVQADGKVSVVEDKGEAGKVMDRLAEKANIKDDFWPPVFRVPGGDYTIFKIEPFWLRALDLASKNVKEDTPPFSEIDFS